VTEPGPMYAPRENPPGEEEAERLEAPTLAVVFVSGLYAPDGRDSVSMQNRDYLIGLHDLGVPVYTLDMMEQWPLTPLLKVARAVVLIAASRGVEWVGTFAAIQLLRRRQLFFPFVRLFRWAGRQTHARRQAPLLEAATSVSRPGRDEALVKAMRLKGRPPPGLAEGQSVACVINGYDLILAATWGAVWKEAVAISIARSFPKASRIRWFVHVLSETTRVAPALVRGLDYYDEVWAPAQFEMDALVNSGLRHPHLHKVCDAVDTDLFRPGAVPLPIPGRRGFCFLTLSQYVPERLDMIETPQCLHDLALVWNHARKGIEVLLRAFLQEFGPDEDVCLVVKSTHDGDKVRAAVSRLCAELGWPAARCKQIIPLGGWTETEDLPRIYAAADAFILVSRGEGWGRPLAESMAMGVPSVGTRFGGNTEFMNAENSYLVDYTPVAVSSTMGKKFTSLGEWAEPSVPHLRERLRAILTDIDEARRRGRVAAAFMKSNYSRCVVAKSMLDRIGASFQER
jgi:glycosyltransferase involved in cell wall biosynthesis